MGAEETTTDSPASEVVNTTTAGFITAGLAALRSACPPSDDCESEYNNNKDALCHRCSTETGACSISKRCPGWCDQAGCGTGLGCTCPSVPSLGAALTAEETTTDSPASEVVNTTTAGFITAGLAALRSACPPSDDCESEYNNNKDALCHRCSTETGACSI